MWVWKKYRKEADEAHARAAAAEEKAVASEHRHLAAKRLVATSRSSTAALQRQIELNGWTELLQKAWGAK